MAGQRGHGARQGKTPSQPQRSLEPGMFRAGRLGTVVFRLEEAGLGRSRPYLLGLLNEFPGSQEWPREGRTGQAERSQALTGHSY